MRAVEVTISVSADGSAVIHPHPQKMLKPGQHKVLIIAEETAMSQDDEQTKKRKALSGLHLIRLQQWPSQSKFRREEIYNDDGR